MRVIDADEFQKQIVGMAILNNYPPGKANALCKLIDSQPTAFDVEKALWMFNIDFPMVKWEDEEPWLIEDLKKLEVVDSYE